MMLYSLMVAAGLTVAASAGVATMAGGPGERHQDGSAEARLEQVVQSAIHADGPFFTAEERALVERKCGMAPGSWDGQDISMSDDVLHCANGRRVSDPEVRAMMERAGPRIAARVEAAMGRPEVLAAIDSVAHEATEQALREVHEQFSRPARRR